MTMFEACLMVLGGIAILWVAGETLVASAIALAKWLRVPPLLIGLTFVAFGTSVPELTVSIESSLAGQPAIAIGNVIGSNIANIWLVLGMSALIRPIRSGSNKLWRDSLVMFAVLVGFILIVLGGHISPLLAGLMLVALAVYIFYLYQTMKAKPDDSTDESTESIAETWLKGGIWVALPVLAVSIVFIVSGAHLLVEGAVFIARALGVSEAIIGLSLVAIGTSLPELAISIPAVLRGHIGVAIGHILGSNISNILLILGITGLIAPLPVSSHFATFDVWVMLFATLTLFYSLWRHIISRLAGLVWTSCYVTYIVFLYGIRF